MHPDHATTYIAYKEGIPHDEVPEWLDQWAETIEGKTAELATNLKTFLSRGITVNFDLYHHDKEPTMTAEPAEQDQAITFTASNGIGIKADPDGIMIQIHPTMPWRWMDGYCPGTLQEAAISEYYQHRRDQELGRWRDPENPDHLVYQSEPYVQGYRRIAVVNERDMTGVHTFSEGAEEGSTDPKALTAQRYFAANPEPKPWEAAKPGEVWVIKLQGDAEGQPVGVFDFDGVPHFSVPGAEDFSTRYRRIESGYRIWPTETDDE